MRAAKKEDGGVDDTCGGQRDRHKRRHGYHSLLVGGGQLCPSARLPAPHSGSAFTTTWKKSQIYFSGMNRNLDKLRQKLKTNENIIM